jgi:hypothetical protein
MLTNEQITEFYTLLLTDPLSLPVWWILTLQFMLPAMMIARNDELEKFIGSVSLNGIRNFSICRP